MVRVSRGQFDKLVAQAIQELPPRFAEALETVRIEVRDRPDAETLADLDMDEDQLLLGLYQGVPITERSVEHSGVMPEVIHLYFEDITQVAADEDDLVEQVRVTLLHEVGHHFGLGEDELEELGYH